jgi:PAS domain S-box-containing protein
MDKEDHTHEVILDSITEGVFTVDQNWRIASFNRAAAEITGVRAEEAVGQPCCEVFRSSICETGCALRETLRTGQTILNKPIYIVNAAGDRIPISISTALLRDASGQVIGGVETFRDLTREEELRKQLEGRYTFSDIIGRSPAMQRLFRLIPTVAASDSTVLLEGDSGTGKELFARAIHSQSPRADGPFVAVNCGALPDTLLESELFGYRRGAFTDARQDKPGRFQLADGGTLFLDEIGDVSPAMQVRLLRVLQERVVEPLGGLEPVKVDVRIVAATNRPLRKLVLEGRFREDLFYRIHVVAVQLPRLTERREDIPLLVDHFIARLNRLQERQVTGVTDEALAVLMQHGFPGNVRELENAVEHAFVLCGNGLIKPEHLPPSLRPEDAGDRQPEDRGLTLQQLENTYIQQTLQRHGGNRKAAAEELGINPSTLFRKIRAGQVPAPETDGRTRND